MEKCNFLCFGLLVEKILLTTAFGFKFLLFVCFPPWYVMKIFIVLAFVIIQVITVTIILLITVISRLNMNKLWRPERISALTDVEI